MKNKVFVYSLMTDGLIKTFTPRYGFDGIKYDTVYAKSDKPSNEFNSKFIEMIISDIIICENVLIYTKRVVIGTDITYTKYVMSGGDILKSVFNFIENKYSLNGVIYLKHTEGLYFKDLDEYSKNKIKTFMFNITEHKQPDSETIKKLNLFFFD